MNIEEFFGDWMHVIPIEELMNATNMVKKQYPTEASFFANCTPEPEKAFDAFRHCDYRDLKVVMLGQDPYPQKDVATGILFGNKETTLSENISPSLRVIMDSLTCQERNSFIFDITLEEWAEQGVLMLNSALTTNINIVSAHSLIWRKFTSKLLMNISAKRPDTIFVLFGGVARTFKPYIDSGCVIIECHHPAYYARNNQSYVYPEFDIINTLLKKQNNLTIKWYETITDERAFNDAKFAEYNKQYNFEPPIYSEDSNAGGVVWREEDDEGLGLPF